MLNTILKQVLVSENQASSNDDYDDDDNDDYDDVQKTSITYLYEIILSRFETGTS